ncbi:P-loop containing nucleoside triphosphate hydrolase protein, partial [Tribonema minus]
NAYSSRSHAIFTVTFRQQRGGGAASGPVSRLNLVDLAGSERVGNTGAAGLRLREAGSINRSLAALSDVIKPPLTPSAGGGAAAAAAAFVPYRNSALTRLLRESLGGNARTVVLACVSPAAAHFEETLSTLKYAERAKAVRTHARVNE